MHKLIIAASLTGSIIIFCFSVDLFNTVVMFVLFGILPGSEQPISASQMLMVESIALGLLSLAILRSGFKTLLSGHNKIQHS